MNLTESEKRIILSMRNSKSKDFGILVKLANLDPAKDFRGANLEGVNFGQANLKGYDFSKASLKGANFRHASIEGAIFTNANIVDVEWTFNKFGPFHRLFSPTQTDYIGFIQEKTGIIAGATTRGSSNPSVKAYVGFLPEGASGIEFYSPFPPLNLSVPHLAIWPEGMPGIFIIFDEGRRLAALPVYVTRRVVNSEVVKVSNLDNERVNFIPDE